MSGTIVQAAIRAFPVCSNISAGPAYCRSKHWNNNTDPKILIYSLQKHPPAMSGLEPLVALGLACSIMQVITFAGDTIAVCRTIFNTGSLDPSLDAQAKCLASVCAELEERRRSIVGPVTRDEENVLSVARAILDAAAELRTEIENVCGSTSKGKMGASITGSLKLAWRKRKVDQLQKTILNGQKALEDRLLVRLW